MRRYVKTDYPAIWILRSHIDCPRPSAITTVEYSAKSRNRWKNQSTVEDPDEHSVLEVEAFCFFIINRLKRYTVIDGELVEFSTLNRYGVEVYFVQFLGI